MTKNKNLYGKIKTLFWNNKKIYKELKKILFVYISYTYVIQQGEIMDYGAIKVWYGRIIGK